MVVVAESVSVKIGTSQCTNGHTSKSIVWPVEGDVDNCCTFAKIKTNLNYQVCISKRYFNKILKINSLFGFNA
jgi:hypothetical protein